MYFDYKKCLLNTQLVLQDIKKMAGTQAYLYARKRLAQIYLLTKCKQADTDISEFTWILTRVEKYVEYLKKENREFNIFEFNGKILFPKTFNGFYLNTWYNMPARQIENMTLYEYAKFIENYFSQLEKEEEEDNWDEDEWDDDEPDNGNNPWEF